MHVEGTDRALLKTAYVGDPSRALFPLNEEFAKNSNNSTVGLSGRWVVVQDVRSYNGPYYECAQKACSIACVACALSFSRF
jgi:L-methionine (R)-S-oxide reductase